MRVLALEPYAAMSHTAFLEGLARHSEHDVVIEALPARHWKWRMRTAALHFAGVCEATEPWDVLLASDYLNLAELRALLPPHQRDRPALVYFHENQLTYPLQTGERRDVHFGLTHLYALACAHKSLFNSEYHRHAFFRALEELAARIPDLAPEARQRIARLEELSMVFPLGIDQPPGRPRGAGAEPPVVLWCHRWEYDKDPDAFVDAVLRLDRAGKSFRVRVLGQRFRTLPPAFDRLRAALGDRVEVPGFLSDRSEYMAAVAGADVVVSTARHEFFGLATLEALRAGCLPVLPDDLAYPELLPPTERRSGRFLYPRPNGLAPALARALEAVRGGHWFAERMALIEYTERFHWSRLARRMDALLREAGSH